MSEDERALGPDAFVSRPATRGNLRPVEPAGPPQPAQRGGVRYGPQAATAAQQERQDRPEDAARPADTASQPRAARSTDARAAAGAEDRSDTASSRPAVNEQDDKPAAEPVRQVTAAEFLGQRRHAAPGGPAMWGWRRRVRRATGGLVSPQMSAAERAYRDALEQVQATFAGPRTIVDINPKGGAYKTTNALLTGRTFGVHRGGGVVVWDNNETRGTLGQRAKPANHNNTARELLSDLDRFADARTARIGDLGMYVRGQGAAHFDVLASDERAEVTGEISGADFNALHALLQRFYKLIVIDTGNNMRAENWLRAVDVADLLVVTTTAREDTGFAGLWMLDALDKSGRGGQHLKDHAVTVLCDPAPQTDPGLVRELTDIYGARTRTVVRIPYEAALSDGGVIDYDRLSTRTTTAWLFACAAMAAAL